MTFIILHLHYLKNKKHLYIYKLLRSFKIIGKSIIFFEGRVKRFSNQFYDINLNCDRRPLLVILALTIC